MQHVSNGVHGNKRIESSYIQNPHTLSTNILSALIGGNVSSKCDGELNCAKHKIEANVRIYKRKVNFLRGKFENFHSGLRHGLKFVNNNNEEFIEDGFSN